MNANLDLGGIERDEMSFQNLIGANHINCNTQKWFFEDVTKMQKMRHKKAIVIYRQIYMT